MKIHRRQSSLAYQLLPNQRILNVVYVKMPSRIFTMKTEKNGVSDLPFLTRIKITTLYVLMIIKYVDNIYFLILIKLFLLILDCFSLLSKIC